MNKKGDVPSWATVTTIFFVIVFFVMILMYKPLISVLRASGEDQACVWSVVLAHYSKIADFKVLDTKIKCPMKMKTVTATDINKPFTKDHLARLNTPQRGYNLDNSEEKLSARQEYRLNQLMADELKSCWKKLGQGKMDPFTSEWVNVQAKCVICARYKFDDNVAEAFSGREQVTTLSHWTRYNPLPESANKDSYYAYLKEGNSMLKKDSALFAPWEYSIREPQAIVYMRINPTSVVRAGEGLLALANWPLEKMGATDAVDKTGAFATVAVLDYSKIGDVCNELISGEPYAEEP